MRKSFIFAVACLFACTITTFAEENEDNADLLQSEEYGLISAISGAEKHMHNSEDAVKRSEFVSAFVSALGVEGRGGVELNFSDVAQGSDIYNSLSAAVGMQFISNSQNFRPGDYITLNEALKICVSATGYAIEAEYEGGYPEGYAAVANRLGITDGISASNTLSVKEAYKLIYNTFESDYLVRENNAYKDGKGNVLEVYRDIELIKGIVTANEFTETGGYMAAQVEAYQLKGKIGIDYSLYNVIGDYNKYLGYSVSAYVYNDRNDDKSVLYVHPDKSNNVSEFLSNDMQYENGYICKESEHRKHYNLNKSAEVIYNGRVTYNYDLTSLNNICGSVIIIDNDSDREYDYIIISDYYYMQVASFDKDDMVIRDKYDIKKEIVLEERTVYSVYDDKKQHSTDLGALETGSLIAVKKSIDGSIVDIIIMGRIISGEVDRYSETELVLSGKEYIPSDYFVANDMKNLRGSKAFDFYIGINDEIVAISYIDGMMQYGYIVSTYKDDSETYIGVKIFTQSGKMERFWLDDKVTCDGELKQAQKVLDKINESNTKRLIRYYANDQDKIKTIDFSEEISGGGQRYKEYVDERDILNPNDSLKMHNFASSYNYRASVFYPYFNIQNTLIFKVPSEGNDEDAYAIGYSFADGAVPNANNNGPVSAIEVYNVGMDGTAEVLVVHAKSDSTSIDQINPKIILVEKVYEEISKNNEILTTIIGWENGKFTKHHIKDNVEIKKEGQIATIESGDVLIFSENSDGEITAAVVEFIGSKTKRNEGNNLGVYDIHSALCHYQDGSVYSLENSWALISAVPEGNGYSYDSSLVNVKIPDSIAIYNQTTKKIRTGTKDDIKTYFTSDSPSYIFVKQHYGTSNFCIIFEK